MMILYRNTKAIVHSPNGNTNLDIVAGVLQGDTLEPYMSPRLCTMCRSQMTHLLTWVFP